jgi:hypothetical protein
MLELALGLVVVVLLVGVVCMAERDYRREIQDRRKLEDQQQADYEAGLRAFPPQRPDYRR